MNSSHQVAIGQLFLTHRQVNHVPSPPLLIHFYIFHMIEQIASCAFSLSFLMRGGDTPPREKKRLKVAQSHRRENHR